MSAIMLVGCDMPAGQAFWIVESFWDRCERCNCSLIFPFQTVDLHFVRSGTLSLITMLLFPPCLHRL
jgi:hypothetical protein